MRRIDHAISKKRSSRFARLRSAAADPYNRTYSDLEQRVSLIEDRFAMAMSTPTKQIKVRGVFDLMEDISQISALCNDILDCMQNGRGLEVVDLTNVQDSSSTAIFPLLTILSEARRVLLSRRAPMFRILLSPSQSNIFELLTAFRLKQLGALTNSGADEENNIRKNLSNYHFGRVYSGRRKATQAEDPSIQIIKEMDASFEIDRRTRRYLYDGIRESRKNVDDHAYNTKFPAIRPGAYWLTHCYDPNREALQILFRDLGIGIPESIRQSESFNGMRNKSDFELLKLACQPGTSTKSFDFGSTPSSHDQESTQKFHSGGGFGLTNVVSVCREGLCPSLKATIFSGRAILMSDRNDEQSREKVITAGFAGTMISIELSVRRRSNGV